jgi:hypothetical protein
MFGRLDSVPWKELTHAYGSAEDVPGLLRALRTASPDLRGENSPLWKLFGNIWHQGTVYEATAYAVPFLIELAADPLTPDRAGILNLLAEIARGSSYLAVHRSLLRSPPDFDLEEELARELAWVANAHGAVASGVETLIALAMEGGDLGLAACHVLAQLQEHAERVAALMHRFLATETLASRRAGLLFLLGLTGDRSSATFSVVLDGLSAPNESERRAAASSIARLRPEPMPSVARRAILEALLVEDLEESFDGLPWDAAAEVDRNMLLDCLDEPARTEAAERLISAIEAGGATDTKVGILLDIIFPRDSVAAMPPALTWRDLSPMQARAVRAMAKAMEGSRRIFFGHFPYWGLPDTRRGWRDLAAGRSLLQSIWVFRCWPTHAILERLCGPKG